MSNIAAKWIKFFKRIMPGVIKAGMPVLFSLCVLILVIYGLGSSFSDKSLVILLRLLRYTAFLLALLSFFALAHAIRRLAGQRLIRFVLYTAACLLSGVFGLGLAVFCSVIIVLSAGN